MSKSASGAAAEVPDADVPDVTVKTSRRSTTTRLGVHLGKILYYRIARIYPSLMLTMVEAAQNAIDADATRVLIAIDQKASRVVVVDNGIGVTEAKFNDALDNVGDSQKRRGQLGQFGIGLISPLNKCKLYEFYSRPAGHEFVNHWTLEGDVIKTQKHPDVPYEEIDDLPEIPSPFRTASRRLKTRWNTMVLLEETTQDKTTRTVELDALEHEICVKLSNGMRKKNTVIHVVINDENGNVSSREILPMVFTGEPLEEVVYDDVDCGRVVFQLYRASKTKDGRKGEVVVKKDDDLFQISWAEYRVQAMGPGYLTAFKDAFNALWSGYFEGVIILEKVTLDAERTKFEMDDALRASYMVVDRWYQEHGQKYFEDEQESRREERYRQLGEQSLTELLAQVADDPHLHSVLEDLLGSVPAPVPREANKSGGAGSTAKRRRTVAEPRDQSEDRSKDDSETGADDGDRADSDETQIGKRRTHARLRFGYEQDHRSGHVWQFDHDETMIVFNTIHPEWAGLDETPDGRHLARHDKWLIHLQLYVGLEVLQLLGEYPDADEFDAHRHEIDKRIRPYSGLIIRRTR